MNYLKEFNIDINQIEREVFEINRRTSHQIVKEIRDFKNIQSTVENLIPRETT